jgi:5-methylcytosine-specific restriction endonuclease McrA
MIPRQCIRRHWGGCSDNGNAVEGTSRCRAHTDKSGWATYAVKHPERAAAYRSPHWKGLRDAQLAKQPNCEARFPGCRGRASEADHVTPLALGGDFFGPLRSVCRPCHLKLTAEASKESKRRQNQGPWGA